MNVSYDPRAALHWNPRYNKERYIASTMYTSCYFQSSHSRFMFGVHKEQCEGRSDKQHRLSESETGKLNVDDENSSKS